MIAAADMVTAGDRTGGRSRVATLGWWIAHVLGGCAVVVAVAVAKPDVVRLSFERWLGLQVAHGALPLALGNETFSSSGAYAGALGWLGAFAAYLVSLGGVAAGRIETMLAALVALALVEWRARRDAGAFGGLAAALLAALCAFDAMRPGGGIETAAFAAGLTLLLARPSARSALLVFVLAVVWCNVAPQGLLAPLIAFPFALGYRFERQRSRDERRWSLVALTATAIATYLTPALGSYAEVAVEALRVDRTLGSIVALHPADLAPVGYHLGFTLAAVGALVVGVRRGAVSDALLVTIAILLALADGAYVSVFGVLAAPALARSAAALWPKTFARSVPETLGGAATALGAVVVAALVAATSVPPAPATASTADLAHALAADGRPHRLFCANLDWCDEAVALGAPNLRVFMDGRIAAYSSGVFAGQRDIALLKPGWRGELAAAGIDALMLRRDRAAVQIIGASPYWLRAGADRNAVLFVHRDGAAKR